MRETPRRAFGPQSAGPLKFIGAPGSFPGEPEMRAFYMHVLPYRPGLYGYMGRRPKDGAAVSHGLCSSLDQLIATTWSDDHQGRNCYFNSSTFLHSQGVAGKDGKLHFRSQENAKVRRTFGFDIDTRISKPQAPYAGQAEAMAAIVAMCEAEKLPLPTFVDSGGGLHGHWPANRDLTHAEWMRYAVAIASAMRAHGIHADHQVTINFVGVLRPVGTHHVKTGKMVALIGELAGPFPLTAFDHLVEKYRGDVKRELKAKRTSPVRRLSASAAALWKPGRRLIGADLVANLHEPSDPAMVVTACQQLAGFAQDPGAYKEPFHYLAAGLLGNCGDDGRQFYIDLLDDDWRVDGEAKVDQWLNGGWGPTTCQKFELVNLSGCDGCPYRGEITSPIQLGHRIVPLVLPHKPPVVLK